MRSVNTTILSLTALVLSAGSLSGQAQIKCWTNDEGVRECGNRVPPEYAQKQHEELNEMGMVIEQQERAKTEAELQEEARQAAIAKEKERQREEQARQDRILLYTFSSVSDIETARDDQVSAIEANIRVTQKRNESIQADLDQRVQAAATAERGGRAPGESLLKDIESLQRQLSNNKEYIEERRRELEAVREEYAGKIERFKELKGEG